MSELKPSCGHAPTIIANDPYVVGQCKTCWFWVNMPNAIREKIATAQLGASVNLSNKNLSDAKKGMNCVYFGDRLGGSSCGGWLHHCTLDDVVCSRSKCKDAKRSCLDCPFATTHVQVEAIASGKANATYKRFEHTSDGGAVYCHSGDSGDIIYSLQAVHDLQAEVGRQAEFVLYPLRGTRVFMSPEHAANLIPLLEVQSYLSKASWSMKPLGIRLDRMARKYWAKEASNLQDHYSIVLTIDRAHQQGDWLSVPEPKEIAEVVVARSHRYRSQFPWSRVNAAIHGKAVFVGTKQEHADYVVRCGEIEHYPTKDLLEVAQVIAGAKLFVGNQSCPRAIAEGLKKPVIVETGQPDDTRFDRPDSWYGNKQSFWCEKLEEYARNQQVNSTASEQQSIRHQILRRPGR